MKKLLIIFILLFFTACVAPKYTSLLSGDCVDRAVHIRQSLIQQGYEAEIILGIIEENGEIKGHAWIRYKDKETGEWIIIKNY